MKLNKLFSSIALCTSLTFGVNAFAKEEVTLYAANSEDAIQVVLDVAHELEPDLKVNVIKASTGTLLQRIKAEQNAPKADIFWSSGFGTLASHKELMAPYAADAAATMPAALKGPDNMWIGSNVHVVVFMVNNKMLDGAAPQGWDALLSGQYKGKIAFGDPSASSSSYLQLFGIYKKYGEEGVKKLAENVTVTGGSSSVYRGVANGEYPLGITIEYAGYRYVAGGQKEIELVYPQEGTFLSPEGLFMVKNAPHPEAAKKLYNVLSSAQFQKTVLQNSYRRPTRNDINLKDVVDLPNLDEINVFAIDQTEAGQARESLLALWKQAVDASK